MRGEAKRLRAGANSLTNRAALRAVLEKLAVEPRVRAYQGDLDADGRFSASRTAPSTSAPGGSVRGDDLDPEAEVQAEGTA